MKRVLAIFLALTAGVALAQDGELPAGAAAQPINELASTATLILRGEPVDCYYNPIDGTWSPPEVLKDPTAQNILNTASVALKNANTIAAEYNLLLTQFNEHVLAADANFVTIQTDQNSLKKRVDQILSDIDKEVDVHVCTMCEEGAETLAIKLEYDGSYSEGVVYQENCVKAALSAGNSLVSHGRYAANNRQRIIDLEDWRANARTTLNNHSSRITALENKPEDDGCDCDFDLSLYATEVWADNQHSLLEDKANLIDKEVKKIDDKLNKHLLNCEGGDEEITISTCTICDGTGDWRDMFVYTWDDTFNTMTSVKRELNDCSALALYTEMSLIGFSKQGRYLNTIMAELQSEVDGFDGRITSVENEVGTYSSRIGTLETNYDSFTKPNIESLLKKPHFNKVNYGGTAGTIADALEGKSSIGGKIMVLADNSPTNFYTLNIGELTYPECEGLSSNEVDTLIKHYIDSDGGGCTCTPDEYIKEETDPVWEKEKSSYATLQDLEEVNDILGSLIEQMQLEIEKLEGDIAIVQNMAETTITATRFLDERITALESLTNNITGGN